MANILETAKDAARDRIRTGKNSVAMKIAAGLTIGTAIFGFGYSLFEYGSARSDADNAVNVEYTDYGLSAKSIKAIQAHDHEAEHQADERSLALLFDSLEATGIALGGLELTYRSSSRFAAWHPERRGSTKLLGIHAVSYRLFGSLEEPLSSIEWGRQQTTNRLQLGMNPYEDSIPEKVPGTPPMSPPQRLENGRYY